jgi:hypothetical protein
MNNAEKVANFERIETLVREGKLETMSSAEVKTLRNSLLTEAPLSDNPKFQQRLHRVESALANRLSEEKSWWEKPLGIILISVVGSVIAAAIAFYLGWL